MIEGLKIKWQPKEDITLYELSLCLPILIEMSNSNRILPCQVETNQPYARHFQIEDNGSREEI